MQKRRGEKRVCKELKGETEKETERMEEADRWREE